MRAGTNKKMFDKNNAAADQGGITVVDIYSEWSGPCTAMQTALKKIKLEVGGDDDDDDENDRDDDYMKMDDDVNGIYNLHRLAKTLFSTRWQNQTQFLSFTCLSECLCNRH